MPQQSPSGNQTVTQVQQIPQYEQDYKQGNMALANSIASTPYPVYQGQLQAPMTDMQQAGMAQAGNAATAYQPGLNAAGGALAGAMSLNPGDAGQVGQYMSPYVMNSLMPQLQAIQTQMGLQQRDIDRQATQANAFGDARQGAQAALANHYGNQTMAGILGQGFNTAFNNAMNTMQNQQQFGLNASNQAGALAGQAQGMGITGANALYNAGQQQQGYDQTGLNLAYQQFQNQVNWPQQMLALKESVLSNNPYSRADSITLPSANGTAQGLGSFAQLAGALGSLGSGNSPFGKT